MLPRDLNATTVVGRLKTPSPGSTAVAFSHADGVTTPLNAPPSSTSSNADAINGAGVIVGDVDGGDLGIVLADWGVEGPHPADLNGDGIVDGGDVGIMLSVWGRG